MVKRDFIRNIVFGLILIVVAILLRVFVFSTVKVDQAAANSYLKIGDIVTVKKNMEPNYKDFVVYTVKGKDYMSRVIASEEQTVTYMDDIFYLNNKVEDQTYIEKQKTDFLSTSPMGSLFTDDFNILTISGGKVNSIPKGKYLVLNDNRVNRMDSRTFGFIDQSQIKGIVTFRILPLKDFGFVEVE
ncbi:signal peptidase I [Streptococcus iniae]|uniref:signal peptidase I n=1 Tax=Streptococcus iniae TaxID=1346 RepID=UPI0008DAF767|nr:signal peptidase I [Streptococcus iniae]OHX26883.1 signal peptidase I [Streptococcus iniae]RLV28018.1 signal peptidase I [Streptococcus iniae]